MTNSDAISLSTAIYGAVVATASLVLGILLGIAELRRNQPRLKVSTSTYQLFNPTTGHTKEYSLAFDIANIGVRPITVNSLSFLDHRKHILYLPDYLMKPVTLADGQAYSFTIPTNVLAAKGFIKTLRAVRVIDSTGKVWLGRIPNTHKKWVLENIIP